MYRRPASAVEEMASPREIPLGFPPGVYQNPHISSASPFARGPHIVFESGPDLWNNGSAGVDVFDYRVFHPRMTQYTNVGLTNEVRRPNVSDGGGVLMFDSIAELLNQKRDARIGGAPPFNADGNSEIFRLKGRRRVFQLTRSQSGKDAGPIQAMNKIVSTNIGHEVSKLAMDLLDEDGLLSSQSAAMVGNIPKAAPAWLTQYMWSLGVAVAGGTANIQKNIIAERVLGLPRDYYQQSAKGA